MIEQRDMDAPWEPEGTEKLVVGAKVRFRMGERPLDTEGCSHCGETDDPVTERVIKTHNGLTFNIIHIYPWEKEVLCAFCHKMRVSYIPDMRYVLGVRGYDEETEIVYAGINVAAIELTLVEEPDEQ